MGKKLQFKIFFGIMFFVVSMSLFACNNTEQEKNNFIVDSIKNNNLIDDNTLIELSDIKKEFDKDIKVGDKIQYGVMAYDDYSRNYIAPMMDWIVLDKDDNKVLLITEKIILASNYIKGNEYTNYEDSLLKSTVEDAYPYIFSNFEREGIVSVEGTGSKVFSPTKQIYDKYFGKMDVNGMNKNAISIASKAAKVKGLDVSSNNDFGYFGSGSYWLSDEVDNNKAMWVGEYGHIYEEGDDKKNLHGVRFCMYVNIDHLVYGKNIIFGNYEQDNIIENGKEKIEWKLLEVKDNKALLMSKNILFCSIFNDKYTENEFFYRDSALRKKLVEDFYNEGFNAIEKNVLCDHKYKIPKVYNVKMDYGDERQEAEEFSDKVFIIDKKEFDRYYKAEEPYAPPENIRFTTNITPYAMSLDGGYYPDDAFSGYIYDDKNTFYWLRDLAWGILAGEYQILGNVRNANNQVQHPRLKFRYGVRPFIEIDLNRINSYVSENVRKIEKIYNDKISTKSIIGTNKANVEFSNDIILGDKYINTIAGINNILEEKYNLNLDSYYYDVIADEKKLIVKAYSSSNEYKGIFTFKYVDDNEGYVLNEELIEQIDICDIRGNEILNDINKKITLRDYELIILRLFNMDTKPKYEKLPIKKELFNKVNKEINKIFDGKFSYAIKSNIIDHEKNANTLSGLDDVIPIDGENEILIDVVSDNMVSRYKVITNIKFIDEISYYIDDINMTHIKDFNKPGDVEKPKEFLKGDNFSKKLKFDKIMKEKKANDTKEKKITTYKELIDKTLIINKEIGENKTVLDNISPVNKGQNSNDNYYFEFTLDKLKFDIVKFGKYKNTPIEWYVLADENGQKLLISKYIIDNKSFSDKNMCASWEISTLRKWLNEDFYNETFSKSEKEKINEIKLNCKNAKKNEYFTTDKVFLLSKAEYEKFFGGVTNSHINSYGIASATDYAKNADNNGHKLFVETNPDNYYEYSYGYSNYWLRDFSNDDYVSNVSPIGQILSEKFYEKEKSGVRPCIFIGTKKINHGKNDNRLNNDEDIPNYKYFLTLDNKDLYMDIKTNVFTFEKNYRINIGRINEDSLYDYELTELDDIFKNSYYFDEKNEKLYFIDWSEKFIEGGYTDTTYYNSLVEIDKNLNKTKIAEKIYEFVCLQDQIIYVYRNKKDVYSYKDEIEKKLNIGEHNYFIYGHHGNASCFVKERTANTNNVYRIEKNSVLKVSELPKDYK